MNNDAAHHHVAFIFGEAEYGSTENMPKISAELATHEGITVSNHQFEEQEFVDFSFVDNADLIVFFVRFWQADDKNFSRLHEYFERGKPAIALRTTSHGFTNKRDWFPTYFGGHYMSHANNDTGTKAVVPPAAVGHAILNGNPGFCEMGYGGTYTAQPLSDTATPILYGKTGDTPAEPIAWTNSYKSDSKIFYTSLGSRENFEVPAFRNLLFNAIYWCLGREVPENGVLQLAGNAQPEAVISSVPAPPSAQPPENAEILFDGLNFSHWRHWDFTAEPKGMRMDGRAHTASGKPEFDGPRWQIQDGALVARPGYGDVLSKSKFKNYKLHLNFLLPQEPAYYPSLFHGASGVYLDGRYEIDLRAEGCGAIHGLKNPDIASAPEKEKWHTLEIEFTRQEASYPQLSAWINGKQIHNCVKIYDRTPYGFLEGPADMSSPARFTSDFGEDSRRYDLAADYAISARFKTDGDGVLVAKAWPVVEMQRGERILSVLEGKLCFAVQGSGSLSSESDCADGAWHNALVSRRGDTFSLYLDGTLQAKSDDLSTKDIAWQVFKIGFAGLGLGNPFPGEIQEVSYYNRAVLPDEAGDATITWTPEKSPESATPSAGVEGGPIRLQADISEVRFANIWVQPID